MKHWWIILVFVSEFLTGQNLSLPLKTGWHFRQKGKDVSYPASVPGTVHTDLLRNGLIKDPFYGTNEASVQWVEQEDWEYSTSFEVGTGLLKYHHVELTFDGLDTYATVFLNGQLILTCNNMFRSWTTDIKKQLKPGKNTLRIVFESAVKKGKAKAAALPYTLPGDEKVFTRKAQYQYGWDWGPRLVTCGIYKPVYLNCWNDVRLNDLSYFIQTLHDSVANIGFATETESTKDLNLELELHLGLNDTSAKAFQKSYTLTIKKGIQRDTFYYSIRKPQLWYSNGLGKANLYHARLHTVHQGKTVDQTSLAIGLKQLELVREKDAFGESFFFRLNGEPVFMKGANYIPQHSFVTELRDSNYKRIVKLAKDANMNMLRVWGGGLYEDDAFYEQCDQNGILVWQDFMFACAMYPGDTAFVENVKQEVAQQASRLRNHPCLALWCGNNEIDEGWHNWGWQKQYNYSAKDSALIWNNYKTLFQQAIPGILKQYDPHTAYWPSSPSIGWGRKESLVQGDAHYWGVWWGMESFEVYEKKTGRFMSEYGFQGMPSLDLFKTFCDSSERHLSSATVKAHQKHPTGYQTIQTYMERDYPVPAGFEKFIYVSQLLQRDAMKIAIEAHRRAMPYCMGTLYWQLNDCWPVTSWSALDNTYKPKALYYETKKLFGWLSLSIHQNGADYEVFVISDKPVDEQGVFTMTLKNTKGDTLLHKQNTLFISSNSSVVHTRLKESELKGLSKKELYLSCSIRDAQGNTITQNQFFFVKPKELLLYDPGISIELSTGRDTLSISAKHFAKDLYLFSDQQELSLSDNFINIEPGQTVKLCAGQKLKPGTTLKYFSLYHCSVSK